MALLAWSCSEKQREIIGQLAKGVVLLLDWDKQDQTAPVVHLLSRRVWVKCPGLPEGIADPEHLSVEAIRSVTWRIR